MAITILAVALSGRAGAAGGESCETATVIASLPFADADDTTGHTNDRDTLPAMCSEYISVNGPDLAYAFTLGAETGLRITVTPTLGTYDASVYVFEGCGSGATCIGGADVGSQGVSEVVALPGLAPGTYYIWVDSFYESPPNNAGSYTIEVAEIQATTTTTTTTNPTATTTTLPGVCVGGAPTAAVVKLGKIGRTEGSQTYVVTGKVVTPAGALTLDPANRGIRFVLEDLGEARTLLDATVPPGAPGTGCSAKDGWKKLAYKNRSGALDPPVCSAGSAQGLRTVRFKDKRAKGGGIVFALKGRGAALPAPTGPLRATLVLAADPVAGDAGACGSYAFPAGACKAKRARFRCK